MKKLLILFSALLFMSFLFKRNKLKPEGIWELNLVSLNGDTIFLRNNYSYTLKYNLNLSESVVKNKKDSIKVSEQAKKNFENSMSITIKFLSDSTFSMTKMRSGGRVSTNEKDYGIYELIHDSLFMTNHTRNGHKMLLKVDAKNNKIFREAKSPNYSIYQEYKKRE